LAGGKCLVCEAVSYNQYFDCKGSCENNTSQAGKWMRIEEVWILFKNGGMIQSATVDVSEIPRPTTWDVYKTLKK